MRVRWEEEEHHHQNIHTRLQSIFTKDAREAGGQLGRNGKVERHRRVLKFRLDGGGLLEEGAIGHDQHSGDHGHGQDGLMSRIENGATYALTRLPVTFWKAVSVAIPRSWESSVRTVVSYQWSIRDMPGTTMR